MNHPVHVLTRLYLILLLFTASGQASAVEFSTDFESISVTSVADFSISDSDLSATFSGGTNFTIGNGSLYHSGTKSWMIDPAGDNGSRGTSTGVGTITFSESPTEIEFYIRTQNVPSNPAIASVEIVDSSNGVVHQVNDIGSADWTNIRYEVVDGAAAIRSVEVNVTGGGMVAIDDLDFSAIVTSTTDDGNSTANSGGGTLNGWMLFAWLLITGISTAFKRARIKN